MAEKGSDKSNEDMIYKTMVKNYLSCNRIEDNLYLGDRYTTRSWEKLKDQNIGRVLSIMNHNIEQYEGIVYKQIKVNDYYTEDLLTRFPECIEFITEGHNCGQTVYVHCAAGISRSATIVIAFLMHKYKIPFESAMSLVSSKRSVCPNEGFVEQLKLFESMNYTVDVNNEEYIDYLCCIKTVNQVID